MLDTSYEEVTLASDDDDNVLVTSLVTEGALLSISPAPQ